MDFARALDENRVLRRTMRDLVALSTLPAVWAGVGPQQILGSLADVLLGTLSLEFIYVRLTASAGGNAVEVLRSRRSADARPDAWRAALAPLLDVAQAAPQATIREPFGDGTLRVAVTRFGIADTYGVLVSGSRHADFPTEQNRLLLGVAANQTAIVVQRRRAEERVHEQREWLRVTLGSIGDAVVATDTGGRVIFLNAVAEALTGWMQTEAEGKPLEAVFHILDERTRQPVPNPVEQVLQAGRIVGLGSHALLIARDGTERPIDDSAAPICNAAGEMLGVVLTVRDVTGQRRAEQQRSVRLEVTQALSEAATIAEAADAVLKAVGEHICCDAGFFWRVDAAGTALACANRWYGPDTPAHEVDMAGPGRRFEPGEGLPGRVWSSAQPAWIDDIGDDGNFPRSAEAARHGLRSAFACPVVIADRVLGVIEFLTRRRYGLDTGLLEMLKTVAGSVGQFMQRKMAEEELRRSEQELADFFDNATIGLHWVGADGRILRANRAELALLGFTREEYVGRPISDFHVDEDVICDILRRLRAGERLEEYPARLRCKDGSIKEVLIDSSVMWRNGEFVHTRCFTRDVTGRKQAEAEARTHEQRARHILESITDAFCALDRGWRFTYVNQQAEALLGRSREDLVGKNHWEEYPDTLGTDLERHFRRALADNVTATFEFFYAPHDRWYECRAYPSSDGLSVYFREVNQRKHAELALRESEQRFRQFADAMPQIAWTALPDGNIDYLNRRWTEFSGLAESVSNEGWAPLLHPEDAPAAYERWAASVRSGAKFEMELRLLDRRQQAYRWHLIRTVAVMDDEGKVARWFGTSTDIHEQKRAAESSRFVAEASAALAGIVDHEETLQKIADLAVPFFADWSAVDLADEDGTLRRLAVAHRDPEKVALVQQLMRDYPPDPQSPTGAFAVLRTGKPVIVGQITDEMIVKQARDERHLRLVRSLGLKAYICVPLVASGNGLGVLTFATAESGRTYTDADLTLATDIAHRAAVSVENTRLYQALREADRRKDEFLATLAHELRNPLAPVRNALQILKMPRVDTQTMQRSREMMERQVQHLVRLVDDLMDMSRVMRGKIELRREKVELATIVANAIEAARPLLDARGHDLSVRVSTESLLLDADPVRLSQVVGNLLTNAAKYTEPGGRIWLTAEREGDMAALRVRDNGIGITAAMIPRIFDLFVQADHAATKAQGGLGIGLTLVKNLVEMHNGFVQARSAGLGRGSEFVVNLPVAPWAPERSPLLVTDAWADPLVRPLGRRVMVVDDNQDAADSLAMLLRLQGHEVRVAYSGAAALEATQNYTPDVVFLDLGMPGMDGYEAARRLRAQPGLGRTVLAALTGWGQEDDRRRTAQAGFDHHLLKPPEPKAVETVLARLPDHDAGPPGAPAGAA